MWNARMNLHVELTEANVFHTLHKMEGRVANKTDSETGPESAVSTPV